MTSELQKPRWHKIPILHNCQYDGCTEEQEFCMEDRFCSPDYSCVCARKEQTDPLGAACAIKLLSGSSHKALNDAQAGIIQS